MTWHIVTWYCELAEKKRQEVALMSKTEAPISCCGRETAASYYLGKIAAAIPRPGNYFQRREGGRNGGTKTRDHRHVANALSMYCIYLVKSAPELLPGPVARTKRVYEAFEYLAEQTKAHDKDTVLANMLDDAIGLIPTYWYSMHTSENQNTMVRQNGMALAKLLIRRPDEIWKTLALVWVQLLVYAAPYGNAEAHMRRLSQGGEFITHLWALLYHLGIREWKLEGNLTEITTLEDVKRIIAEDSQAVVAYLYDSEYNSDPDELATASRLEDGVRYYYTKYSHIAKLFRIDCNKRVALVFLRNEASNHKFTFYDGEFSAYDIARFVTANKIALAHDEAQAQSSEANGVQSEDEIEEEIQPPP